MELKWHTHVNMSCTAFSDPLTARLCLLSKSWTSEHSHACTEVRPRKSSASPPSQCDPCFVPVLVCVERSDTELWVVLLWIWRVRLIGPDHKGTSSLQPSGVHPPGSGSNGLVWLHGGKNRFQASDTWVRLFSYYFIYSQLRVNWRTVIKLLFTITISPYQKDYSLSKWVEWYSKHLRNDKIRRDVWMKASRHVGK